MTISSHKIKALLVEDLKIAQKVASLTLAQLNCETDIAETGAQALELASKQRYDIIFVDLGLPDTDGATVTKTIRRTKGKNSITPIVALTAHSETNLKEAWIEIGFDAFLEKPLTLQAAQIVLGKFVLTEHAKQTQG